MSNNELTSPVSPNSASAKSLLAHESITPFICESISITMMVNLLMGIYLFNTQCIYASGI